MSKRGNVLILICWDRMILSKKHKSLFKFVFLNYLDKGLSFILPLLILYLTSNIELYNNIEYIFSIASIIAVLVELGGRIYIFYAYTHDDSEHREQLLENVKKSYLLLNSIYIAISFIFIICNRLALANIVLYLIVIRSLFLFFINSYANFSRLKDKPQNVLYFSICINIISILVIVLFYKQSDDNIEYSLFLFFITQILFLIYLSLIGLKHFNQRNIKFTLKYIRKAFLFSWPVILNLLLITFINNYGKILVFNNFSDYEMYSFSYMLRISMIIQMAHSSIIAFYSKEVYLDSKKNINKKIYQTYILFLILAMLGCVSIVLVINKLDIIPPIEVNSTTLFLILYVFFWCQYSYFEQYLGKYNRNRWILYISCFGLFVYCTLLFINPFHITVTVNYISICMLVSSIVNCIGMIYCLNKIKLIKL